MNTQGTANHSVEAPVSRGLEGVVAANTQLSWVDGVEGRLYYRGIAIHELAEKACFEEVAHFLWFGNLPTETELEEFKTRLAEYRVLPDEVLAVLKKLPKTAHPMSVLRTMVSVLGLMDPDEGNLNEEGLEKKAFILTGALPTVLAAFYRLRLGKKIIAPDLKLSHAANYLYMMTGKKPDAEMERALDAYLILLSDHGLNASTFSARVTVATLSDMYSAITSAVGTLKGSLHGSANQRAMEMILDIGTPKRAEKYVLKLLKERKKIMGFGHRIYKKQDPRAVAFSKIAEDMCERSNQKKWYEISQIVERVVWEKKQIPTNVDFFSASVLYILGFPIDFFTTVFAASRVVGWTAHVMEQLKDNRLIRPTSNYIGPIDVPFVPVEKRSYHTALPAD